MKWENIKSVNKGISHSIPFINHLMIKMTIRNYFENDLLTISDDNYNEELSFDEFGELQICTGVQSLFQALRGQYKTNIGALNTTLLVYGSNVPQSIGEIMDKNLQEEIRKKITDINDQFSDVILNDNVIFDKWNDENAKLIVQIWTVDEEYEIIVNMRTEAI